MNLIRIASILAGLTSLACIYSDKPTAAIAFMGIALTLWLTTWLKGDKE